MMLVVLSVLVGMGEVVRVVLALVVARVDGADGSIYAALHTGGAITTLHLT